MKYILSTLLMVALSFTAYADSESFFIGRDATEILEGKLKSDLQIKKLLNAGLNPNKLDPTGLRTPLYAAAGEERIETIKILINNDAKLDFRPDIGGTPLNVASYSGSEEVVKVLLEAGANPCVKNFRGHDSFSLSECRGFCRLSALGRCICSIL